MAFSTEEVRWLYTALKKVEFLSLCSMGELEQLMSNLTRKAFSKGTTIVREGDDGDYLFLIHSGEVAILAKSGFGKKEIARLGPGNYFGEMALVSREPRSATVEATQDTDAFLLFSTDFRRMLDKNPGLAKNLDDIVAKRRADRDLELLRQGGKSGGLWASLKKITGM